MRGSLGSNCVLACVVASTPACKDDAAASESEGDSEVSTSDASATAGDSDTGDATPSICDQLGVCSELEVDAPTMGEPVQIAPSKALPPEVASQYAHNNLDVAWHDGRLFFAFRTAPTHFADVDAEMFVVSSADLKAWDFELKVSLGTDVREPQFLSIGGELLFYHAVLGQDPFNFEPMGTRYAARQGLGAWGEAAEIFDADFIPWRIKTYDGVTYLTGYTGGGAIYQPGQPPVEVQWLTTEDGVQWTPVIEGQPTVLTGGSSETDFVFTEGGDVVAVSRNEAGDELGFGMKVCRADAGDLGAWTCVADPKKYDSPLLFTHAGGVYLLGRRNVTETGWYDLMLDGLTHEEKYGTYQVEYSKNPKRCSLWRVDPETLAITLVDDLPSRGDTCFPELVPLNERQYLVFNYTSPLDGDDYSWIEGQSRPTLIYYVVLTMPT